MPSFAGKNRPFFFDTAVIELGGIPVEASGTISEAIPTPADFVTRVAPHSSVQAILETIAVPSDAVVRATVVARTRAESIPKPIEATTIFPTYVQVGVTEAFAPAASPQTVTFTNPDVAGNAIIVTMASQQATVSFNAPTDTEGNKYQVCSGASCFDNGGTGNAPTNMQVYVAFNIVGGTTNTVSVSWTGAAQFIAVNIFEIQGISSYDAGVGLVGTSATANAGVLPISFGNEIVVACTCNTGSGLSVGAGFTLIQITGTFQNVLEYATQSFGSITPTANMSGSQTWGIVAGAFYQPMPRAFTGTRSIAESVAASDALTRAFVGSRTLSEAISFADALTRIYAANRALNETVSFSDAIARSYGANRTTAETVSNPLDAITRAFVGSRLLSEAVSFSDAVARVASALRSVPESVATPTDSVVQALGFVLNLPGIPMDDWIGQEAMTVLLVSFGVSGEEQAGANTLAFALAASGLSSDEVLALAGVGPSIALAGVDASESVGPGTVSTSSGASTLGGVAGSEAVGSDNMVLTATTFGLPSEEVSAPGAMGASSTLGGVGGSEAVGSDAVTYTTAASGLSPEEAVAMVGITLLSAPAGVDETARVGSETLSAGSATLGGVGGSEAVGTDNLALDVAAPGLSPEESIAAVGGSLSSTLDGVGGSEVGSDTLVSATAAPGLPSGEALVQAGVGLSPTPTGICSSESVGPGTSLGSATLGGVDGSESVGSGATVERVGGPGLSPGESGASVMGFAGTPSGLTGTEAVSGATTTVGSSLGGLGSAETLPGATAAMVLAPRGLSTEEGSPAVTGLTASLLPGLGSEEVSSSGGVAFPVAPAGVAPEVTLGAEAVFVGLGPNGISGEAEVSSEELAAAWSLFGLPSGEEVSKGTVGLVASPAGVEGGSVSSDTLLVGLTQPGASSEEGVGIAGVLPTTPIGSSGVTSGEGVSSTAVGLSVPIVGVSSGEGVGEEGLATSAPLPGVSSNEALAESAVGPVLQGSGMEGGVVSPGTMESTAMFDGIASGSEVAAGIVGTPVGPGGLSGEETAADASLYLTGASSGIAGDEVGPETSLIASFLSGLGTDEGLGDSVVVGDVGGAGASSDEALGRAPLGASTTMPGIPPTEEIGTGLAYFSYTFFGIDSQEVVNKGTVTLPEGPVRPAPVYEVGVQLQMGAEFQPTDLVIRTFKAGRATGPVYIAYALYQVRGDALHLVGPAAHSPATRELGIYYVTGTVGEGGQPGVWMVRWTIQEALGAPFSLRDFYFSIRAEHVDGRRKLGWDSDPPVDRDPPRPARRPREEVPRLWNGTEYRPTDLVLRVGSNHGVTYALYQARGQGFHRVGPEARVPSLQGDFFHVTGTVGEGGQPGLWMIRWTVREPSGATYTRDSLFEVLDAVARGDMQGRHRKFGWD